MSIDHVCLLNSTMLENYFKNVHTRNVATKFVNKQANENFRHFWAHEARANFKQNTHIFVKSLSSVFQVRAQTRNFGQRRLARSLNFSSRQKKPLFGRKSRNGPPRRIAAQDQGKLDKCSLLGWPCQKCWNWRVPCQNNLAPVLARFSILLFCVSELKRILVAAKNVQKWQTTTGLNRINFENEFFEFVHLIKLLIIISLCLTSSLWLNEINVNDSKCVFRKRTIDTVNQGNWCLSIKLRIECFVIVA